MFQFYNLHNRLSINFLEQSMHSKKIFKGTENIAIFEENEKYFSINGPYLK